MVVAARQITQIAAASRCHTLTWKLWEGLAAAIEILGIAQLQEHRTK